MKNPFSLLSRLPMVLAAALALGACSRAEYATLPRSTPYLGSTLVASAPRPAAQPAAPVAAPAQAPAAQTAAVVVAPAPAVATAPATPVAPVAAATLAEAAVAMAPQEAPAAAPHKLNLVQRLAVAKVTKKINKMAAKMPQRKANTASTTRGGLDENLRIALLLTVAAILVGILAGLVNSGFIGAIAVILFIVALVFAFLWLLDNV